MTQLKRPYPHYLFPNEINISYKKLTESECKWFNVPQGSWDLTTANYGWLPTNIIMGVVDRRFVDTNNLGANISGNMGTASIAVVNIEKAISMLKSEGYNIIENQQPCK